MKPMNLPPAAAPMAVPAAARMAPPAAVPKVQSATPGTARKGAVVQKPHNPANHVSQMPTYGNGGKVKGYAKGGMVKGGKGC
jgi:hypothetical protein